MGRVKNGLGFLITAATVAFSPGSLGAAPRNPSEVLENGSRVSLRGQQMPLSKVLELVERTTGNRIRCLGTFGSEDREALSQKVTLNLRKATFWEAAMAIQEATGLEFKGVEGGALLLAKDVFKMGHDKPAGDPVVAGALLLVPEINTFMKKMKVIIRPEPWVAALCTSDYRALLTLEDGKKIEYRPEPSHQEVSKDKGLELDIEPELPKETERIREMEIEARLEVLLNPKPVTTPRVGDLASTKMDLGKAKVRVIEAEMTEAKEGKVFSLRFEVEGGRLVRDDVSLLDKNDQVLKTLSSSSSGGFDATEFHLRYLASTIKGEPRDLRLALNFPVLVTRELGEVRHIAGKTVSAGPVKLKVTSARTSANGRSYDLKIEATGPDLPSDAIRLMDPEGQTIEYEMRSSSSVGSTHEIHVIFPTAELKGPAESCQLVVDVPVRREKRTISDLPGVAAKGYRSGPAEVRIVSAEDDPSSGEPSSLRLRLEVRGAPVLAKEALLVDPRGRTIEPEGWSQSQVWETQYVTLDFPRSRIRGKPEEYRLRLPVPQDVVKHTLKATLEDLTVRP